jgi:hypothetical protein
VSFSVDRPELPKFDRVWIDETDGLSAFVLVGDTLYRLEESLQNGYSCLTHTFFTLEDMKLLKETKRS